jgi:hypothetical protein
VFAMSNINKKFSFVITIAFMFSLLEGCATKSNLQEKVDAKGVYHTPNSFENKELNTRVKNPSEIGQRITQTTIKRKSIYVDGNIFNAATNSFEYTDLAINLRAQVILFEQKDNAVKGACYSKTNLNLPNTDLHKVFLYGKKVEGLSQLKRDTMILQFQSNIPSKYSQGLEEALNWCWKYVYYLDQQTLISGYSAIFSSLAINIPVYSCTPKPVKSYLDSKDCRAWYNSLPPKLTHGTVAVCANSSYSSTRGRCELRGAKNSFCPYISSKDNTRVLNAGDLSELTGFTKSDLSGQKLFLCPEGTSYCKKTGAYKFTKLGKKVDDIFVCR